jgi:hypothetical protein
MYISYVEPYQPQALVWPYQAAASMPHLQLLPPLTQQQLQPPPLAPLQILGSDYLTTASTTLHQVSDCFFSLGLLCGNLFFASNSIPKHIAPGWLH